MTVDMIASEALAAHPQSKSALVYANGRLIGGAQRQSGKGNVSVNIPAIHSLDYHDHLKIGTGKPLGFRTLVEVRGMVYSIDDRAEIGAVW